MHFVHFVSLPLEQVKEEAHPVIGVHTEQPGELLTAVPSQDAEIYCPLLHVQREHPGLFAVEEPSQGCD